eukprot:CAMPEP_0178443038 /NCGR_PEP_ID=MMETSP0689_2-20121128/38585_1 /TAXON_ID=160604 /ORGANISM="Amphidinium massartii, Strain CS-259" /LENGTH=543 /DNA_ID=CAMNT_0020066825 /DNA_START=72 /DNA_END=1699 /DNA_ORIENTATION=+
MASLHEPLLGSMQHQSSSESGTTGSGTTWVNVSWLMISDIVGTSVLTFAGVAYELGWALSIVFIVGLFPISLFVSVLMSRTRELLLVVAGSQPSKEPPRVDTMGAIATASLQHPWAGPAVYLAVYGYTALGQGSYLLVLGTSWQQTFFADPSTHTEDQPLCLPIALIYCCLVLLIPVCVVRKLGDSVWLCLINTILIVIVIAVALTDLAMYGSREETRAHAFAPGLSLSKIMGATTNIVYAYAGQWMYFELMDTMSKPSDFPWAFAVSGPFMVTVYLAVALLGYGLGAGRAQLLRSMAVGPTLRFAAAMLFAHVVIVYLIKNVVLARYFLGRCRPEDVDAKTCKSYLNYSCISVAMLLLGYFVANAVPFFNQLLGLMGGLFAGPINFLLPILFYLVALGRKMQAAASQGQTQGYGSVSITTQRSASGDTASSPAGALPAQTIGSPSGAHAPAPEMVTAEDVTLISGQAVNPDVLGPSLPDSGEQASVWQLFCLGWQAMPRWEAAVVCLITVLITLTMGLGVYENVKEIVALEGHYGEPFSCHA